jgi:uncharacterized protein (DUF1330 family)
MSDYVIIDTNMTDPGTYEDYKKLAAPTVEIDGCRYTARGSRTEILEGKLVTGSSRPSSIRQYRRSKSLAVFPGR